MNRASGSRSSKGKEQQAAVSEEPVFPSREKFGQLYQTLRRVCPITEDGHTERLAVMMGWPIEKIKFMLHVFEELELVCVQEQKLKLIPDPVKRELTYSAAYREKLRKSESDQILFADTAALSAWITKQKESFEFSTKKGAGIS